MSVWVSVRLAFVPLIGLLIFVTALLAPVSLVPAFLAPCDHIVDLL